MNTPSLRLTERRSDTTFAPLCTNVRDLFGDGPWLVVVPHDDDLVLGMGLTAACAAREGIEVHVAVATDGSLGYVTPEESASLVETRAAELDAACLALGLDPRRIHRLGLPDGALLSMQGCRPQGEPKTLAQRLVELMRRVRPRHVFVCTETDVHPDHRAAAAETEIASFWASSRIWLELGEPIVEPTRWHYAVYCPFRDAPDLEVATDLLVLDQKLTALACFKSQGVIDPMVERLRADGPFEYLRRASFSPYRPRTYRAMFERAHGHASPKGERFRADCQLTLEIIDAFPVAHARALEDAFTTGKKPLLLVGEGSSQLFPARFAQWLANRGGHGGRVIVAGGREAGDMRLDAYRVCLISNSGSTRELVELTRQLRDPITLLGRNDGALSELGGTSIVVLPRPEQVVPATASVFAQALYLSQAVLSMAGYRPQLARLREAVSFALALDATPALGKAPSKITRVVWADPGHGAAAELALKTMEVAGVVGIYAPGNLLLHGMEEALSEHDLVVWLDPPTEDHALREAVRHSTGATLICVGGESSAWPIPDVGPLTPLVELVVGWRIVEALGLAQGRDPDRTRRGRKVGNPAISNSPPKGD